MVCPYCRTPYTMKQPCFCQSLAAGKKPTPVKAPIDHKILEYQAVSSNSNRGKRID